MTPCTDCTLTHAKAATHVLYFNAWRQCWEINPVQRARYCKWHATTRAVQLNAARRRRQNAAEETA
jgi:hypothetical protein